MGQALSPGFLFDHHPCRQQQRERNQADQSSRGDEQRIADLPSDQNGKGRDTDRQGQPIADRNSPEQDAGAKDGSDGGRLGAFDEPRKERETGEVVVCYKTFDQLEFLCRRLQGD
jgi:hypothetical protein